MALTDFNNDIKDLVVGSKRRHLQRPVTFYSSGRRRLFSLWPVTYDINGIVTAGAGAVGFRHAHRRHHQRADRGVDG
jgi:hypothetical protein